MQQRALAEKIWLLKSLHFVHNVHHDCPEEAISIEDIQRKFVFFISCNCIIHCGFIYIQLHQCSGKVTVKKFCIVTD
jgi:hypothetical protein